MLITSLPDQAPGWTTFTLDTRMVIFTLAVSMLTAVLFGWAPALHAMNSDVRGAMSAATAGSTAPVRGRRTLWALVVAEFALASLMFVCGGLLVRAYDRVRNTDPGFDGSKVLTFAVNIPGATYSDSPKRIAFWNRLRGAAPRPPWRRHSGYRLLRPGERLPLGMAIFSRGGAAARRHRPESDRTESHGVAGVLSGDGHPAEGRPALHRADAVDAFDKASAIIVNETFVKTFWPNGGSAIGKRVRNGEKAPWRPWSASCTT